MAYSKNPSVLCTGGLLFVQGFHVAGCVWHASRATHTRQPVKVRWANYYSFVQVDSVQGSK